MTFVTDNEKVYDKYNEIWEVIRKLLKVKSAVTNTPQIVYFNCFVSVFRVLRSNK